MGVAYIFAYSEISKEQKIYFSCLNACVGGITFGVGALKMITDATEHISGIDVGKYPLANLLAALGFIILFCGDHFLFNSVNRAIKKENSRRKRMLKAANSSDLESGIKTPPEVNITSLQLPNPFDNSVSESSGTRTTLSEGRKQKREEARGIQRKRIYAAARFGLLMQTMLHCVIAGFAVGVQSEIADSWPTIVAIACFTTVATLSVGASMFNSEHRKGVVAAVIFLLVALVFVGFGLGDIIRLLDHNESKSFEGIFLALSAGCFMFMGGKEVTDEFHSKSPRLSICCAFLGFALVASLLTIIL